MVNKDEYIKKEKNEKEKNSIISINKRMAAPLHKAPALQRGLDNVTECYE